MPPCKSVVHKRIFLKKCEILKTTTNEDQFGVKICRNSSSVKFRVTLFVSSLLNTSERESPQRFVSICCSLSESITNDFVEFDRTSVVQ